MEKKKHYEQQQQPTSADLTNSSILKQFLLEKMLPVFTKIFLQTSSCVLDLRVLF